jgi:glycosyltransferase involved in cell wall biosynthesis
MYLVSILVPVWGVEKYIERCARSLFEQTYENLEYIFVDDCSPDKSIEILERVMEDYPNRNEQVRIIRHEQNRGLAAARNTALDNAHGLFISHVDSDDYLAHDAIKLLVNKQLKTDADIVSCRYYQLFPKRVKVNGGLVYENKHEMLMLFFDPRINAIRPVWGRLIRLSLYNDHHIRVKEGNNNGEDWQQIPVLVYYAKTVDKIEDILYYYDCTNEQSYTNVNKKKHTNLWEQSMNSIFIMESFFADKEPEYKVAAHRLAAFGIKGVMNLSARFRVKSTFDKIKNILLLNYADCLDAIGWDNPINRAFRCNYTLYGCYRRMYAFFLKIRG